MGPLGPLGCGGTQSSENRDAGPHGVLPLTRLARPPVKAGGAFRSPKPPGNPEAPVDSRSVVECGSPLPLWNGGCP